jgi:hypothetical protein
MGGMIHVQNDYLNQEQDQRYTPLWQGGWLPLPLTQIRLGWLSDGTGQAWGGTRPRPVGKEVGAGLGWSERPWGSVVGLG